LGEGAIGESGRREDLVEPDAGWMGSGGLGDGRRTLRRTRTRRPRKVARVELT
jgi:hypothetical protein